MLVPCYSAPMPPDNNLLAALPNADWERVAPSLRPVKLRSGEVIYEPGAATDYVVFPTSAIVSLVYLLADGGCAQLAVVGNDGVVGIALFMGGGTTLSRAVVQSGGWAYRLAAHALRSVSLQIVRTDIQRLRFRMAAEIQRRQGCRAMVSAQQEGDR